MATKLEYVRLGVDFAGRCPACGRSAGDRSYERGEVLLYRAEGAGGKFYAVHPSCAGVVTKKKIGGAARVIGEPKTLEVE